MALLMGSHSAFAIPADPALRTYRQPDGSLIRYQIIGDEFSHSVIDLQGRELCFDVATHAFRPMTSAELQVRQQAIDAEAYKAGPRRAPEPGTERRGFYPTTGKRHSLVFLIEFSDLSFTTVGDDPNLFYTRMLNEEGFSEFGATGSARDYYLTASEGLFEPTFDVVGPIRLDKSYSYYGANGANNKDCHQAEPLYEACIIADSLGLVDFTQYDDDQNGIVDNIFYFYAGFGEADTGFEETIWPHSWNLENAELPLTLQGKQIYSYACSNEIRYQPGVSSYEPTGIGTFVHEFAHVLGLPDLYNTHAAMTGMFTHTPTDWSVMDHGSYLNNTNTPPTFSSFERYSVGWLRPQVLTAQADSTLRLSHILHSNQAYLVEVPAKEHEYFLLENRQKEDWDAYLPNHGLLIWHIDYDSLRWAQNTVNVDAKQLIDVYEADGDANAATFTSDVLPGASGIQSVQLVSWANDEVVSPAFVREENGVISFLIANGNYQADQPQSLQASEVDAHGCLLSWAEVTNATSYRVNVWAGDVQVQSHELTQPTLQLQGLEPVTAYTVQVFAYVGNIASEPATLTFTTTLLPFAERTPVVLSATDVQADSFVAHWEALPDASNYLLTLCQLQAQVADGKTGYDFSDKADGLPVLWQTSSTTYYAIAGYYGAASPSLRFSKDQDYLLIAYPEATITSLSFWMRGQKAQGSIDVEWRETEEADWQRLTNIGLSVDGLNVHLELEHEAQAMRILYHRDGGFVAIDDIEVELIAQEHTPLPGFADLAVGDVRQYAFSSLQPETTYTYRIRAVNAAGEQSLSSAEQYVVTPAQQGGEDPGDNPGDDPGEKPETGPTHKILVEEFTGQDCIYCPMGAEYMHTAIAEFEDRVVEVKHHAGYYPDYLTSQADIQIAKLFGVTSAPTGMINRAEFGETLKLTFTATISPDSIRSTLVRELAKPDYVTVNIETTYDEASRQVTARIYGHQLQALPGPNARLNVWVTESGYRGPQQSPTGLLPNYLHTNYQRQSLTDVKGDELTFDADGNYEQTFTYTVPETYPAYTESGISPTKSSSAMPATTRIVAFVANWSSTTDCEVYNANSALIGRSAQDAQAITQLQADEAHAALPVVNLQGHRVAQGQHGFVVKQGRVIFIR